MQQSAWKSPAAQSSQALAMCNKELHCSHESNNYVAARCTFAKGLIDRVLVFSYVLVLVLRLGDNEYKWIPWTPTENIIVLDRTPSPIGRCCFQRYGNDELEGYPITEDLKPEVLPLHFLDFRSQGSQTPARLVLFKGCGIVPQGIHRHYWQSSPRAGTQEILRIRTQNANELLWVDRAIIFVAGGPSLTTFGIWAGRACATCASSGISAIGCAAGVAWAPVAEVQQIICPDGLRVKLCLFQVACPGLRICAAIVCGSPCCAKRAAGHGRGFPIDVKCWGLSWWRVRYSYVIPCFLDSYRSLASCRSSMIKRDCSRPCFLHVNIHATAFRAKQIIRNPIVCPQAACIPKCHEGVVATRYPQIIQTSHLDFCAADLGIKLVALFWSLFVHFLSPHAHLEAFGTLLKNYDHPGVAQKRHEWSSRGGRNGGAMRGSLGENSEILWNVRINHINIPGPPSLAGGARKQCDESWKPS